MFAPEQTKYNMAKKVKVQESDSVKELRKALNAERRKMSKDAIEKWKQWAFKFNPELKKVAWVRIERGELIAKKNVRFAMAALLQAREINAQEASFIKDVIAGRELVDHELDVQEIY